MKKVILLTLLIVSFVQITLSQGMLAKLKYEEAEEDYSNGNFELTLTKLKELEAILKSTNPKIMYLQIMSESKIIEKKPLNDYEIIENARKLSAQYLKDYEQLPDNEDKFRDIYKVSESLKKRPTSKRDFDNELAKIETEKTEKMEKKRIKEEKQVAEEKEGTQRKQDEIDAKLKKDKKKINKKVGVYVSILGTLIVVVFVGFYKYIVRFY